MTISYTHYSISNKHIYECVCVCDTMSTIVRDNMIIFDRIANHNDITMVFFALFFFFIIRVIVTRRK